EKTRYLSTNNLTTPLPCDIICISQDVKFEITELDDTTENSEKTLRNLITGSLKDTCLEYLSEVDPNLLDTLKKEFGGKTFQVSQDLLGSNSMYSSYDNQLKNFNS